MIRRWLRHTGGQVLRRTGLLVGSQPNSLGEDKRLLGGCLEGNVIAFFGGLPREIYQIRQWYGPLAELHKHQGVTIVTRDSRSAQLIRSECTVPVICIGYYSTLDDLLSRSRIELVLYVNFNAENFEMLRFSKMIHAYCAHGDSDKVVSVSNQYKAFDFVFVAGQAAVDRLASNLPLFDAVAKCRIIGRPQLELPQSVESAHNDTAAAHKINVLYAPTWEGGHPSADYGSVAELGADLVNQLLNDARFAVTYRPHPFNGLRRVEYGQTSQRLQALVEAAGANGHRVSRGGNIINDFCWADILLTDISSVAIDFLAFDKPLLVTRPANQAAIVPHSPLLEQIPRLDGRSLSNLPEMLIQQVTQDPDGVARRALIKYYLHTVEPGAALTAFLQTCAALIELNRQVTNDAN
jgi:hypothetical protein